MNKGKAFTFIELIIAVTIFAVIAVSIYSVFNAGLRIWQRTSPMIEANQAARFTFDIMSKDLKNSIQYDKNAEAVNFEGDPGRISFWTLVDMPGADGRTVSELAKVTYYLNTADSTLVRNAATRLDGFKEIPQNNEELLGGIKSDDFGFQYCYKEVLGSTTDYNYEWYDKWEDKNGKLKIPRGLKIKLKDAVKTVFMPTGELGEK